MNRTSAVLLTALIALAGWIAVPHANAEPTPAWTCVNPDTHPIAQGVDARRWGSVQRLEATLNAVAPNARPSDILAVTGLGLQSDDTVICVRQ